MRTFHKWMSYKKIVKELNALDDRELWDIGLTRGDIELVAQQQVYGE